MGLLDILKGAMGGKKQVQAADPLSQMLGSLGGGNPLLKMLLPMLMGGGAMGGLGGLGGLLGKFKNAGMEGKVNSWVGTGANEALTEDEVGQALGDDTLGAMAKESGLPQDQVKSGLAKVLPDLVNNLTPGGKLPASPDQIGGLLKGMDIGSLGKLLG